MQPMPEKRSGETAGTAIATFDEDAVIKLAGDIAHDFNNRLTVILTNLELLKERTQSDALAERLIDSALRAADASAKLANKLLEFSRQAAAEKTMPDPGARIDEMT